MTNRQTAWITLNGITFERSAAIAIKRLSVKDYSRIMARLVRLRFRILQEPLNTSSPEMFLLEKIQIDDLRVWYVRSEINILVMHFELTAPCVPPGTFRLLHRQQIQSHPVISGNRALYRDGKEHADTTIHLPRNWTISPPVAFILSLRGKQLQLTLDAQPENALDWGADWTVPEWGDERSNLMLEAKLLIDRQLQHDTGIQGAFRVWHRGERPLCEGQTEREPGKQTAELISAQNILLQLLSLPQIRQEEDVTGLAAPHMHELHADVEASQQIARQRAMLRAMDLLSKGHTDGWALCLDALRSCEGDIGYDLSLVVARGQRNLRRRWQGTVGIEQ